MRSKLSSLLLLTTVCIWIAAAGCKGETATAPPPPARATAGETADGRLDRQRRPNPVRVLVIGDGFLPEHKTFFETEIVQKVRDGFQLLPGASPDTVVIKSAFLPSTTDVVATTTAFDSRLHLQYVSDQSKCYYPNRAAVLPDVRIQKADGDPDFVPDRYIVVLAGNGDGACAMNDVMFVREDVNPDTIAHEMGHAIGGLYDEYSGDSATAECVKWRNCSTDKDHPPWESEQNAEIGVFAGCRGYGAGIFHPTQQCRMNNPSQPFCAICSRFLETALRSHVLVMAPAVTNACTITPRPHAWRRALRARKALDVIAIAGPSGRLKVLDAFDRDLDSIEPELIVGDEFAVAFEGDEIVGAAPLAIDGAGGNFYSRSYSSTSAKYEKRVHEAAFLLRFTILGVDKATAAKHNLKFGLRSLQDARRYQVVDENTIRALNQNKDLLRLNLTERLAPYVSPP